MGELSFSNVMIGSADPKTLAEFYSKVLGRPADMEEEGWYSWRLGSGSISVGEHSEVKGQAKEPQRVILNFETDDVKGEFERIKGVGGRTIAVPYELQGMWIATLADPDGNYFQVTNPWEGDASS